MGLSLAMPICRINIFAEKHKAQTGVIKMLQVVTDSDEYMDEVIISNAKQSSFSFVDFLPIAYVLVSFILLALLVQMLFSILILVRKHTHTKIEQIHFINTDAAKGTPFSFFKYIFWNKQIDLYSTEGSRIFNHELAHIRERHSWDKMFINLVLVAFWCNPVFWFIRKELSMIHEFIADKKAVEDGDTAAFAAMILATTYPQHNISIANNFFYSPIKRRLTMLTKNNNPSVNYISRLLVLPVLVIVFAAFTLKAKEYNGQQKTQNKNFDAVKNTNAGNSLNPNNPIKLNTENTIPTGNGIPILETNNETIYLENQITVVIDAGHGGKDPGASNKNGTTEKEMALILAKKIKEINKDKNINIILSREIDVYNSVKEKAVFANQQKPDLFISIHLSGNAPKNYNKETGIEIFIATDSFPNSKSSRVLGSAVLGSFKNNYNLKLNDKLQQRKAGIWVLKSVEAPSILIEAGFITNDNDLAYLQSEKGQEAFANNVLNGISFYVSNKNNPFVYETKPTEDSLIKYKGKLVQRFEVKVEKDKTKSIILFFKDKTTKTISEKESLELGLVLPAPPPLEKRRFTKNNINENDVVFTKVENEAEFPGGNSALKAFIQKSLNPNIAKNEKWAPGIYTIIIKFRVRKDGSLSDIYSENYTNTKTANECISIFKNSPKWKPARQNGIMVDCIRKQPVTVVVEADGLSANNITEIALFSLIQEGKGRIKLADFKKVYTGKISNTYEIVSSDVYFGGAGFSSVVKGTLSGNSLASLTSLFDKCVAGTAITIVNIKVKTKDGLRTIDEESFVLY